MSSDEKILGIDLGTSNSGACVYIKDHAEMISSAEGSSLYGKSFPSCVAITDDGELLVGQPALNEMFINPKNGARAFKRKMGENELIPIGNESFTAQELSSKVLTKIKEDAENRLGEKIHKAVITVPYTFNNLQRNETIQAANDANLDVIKLINEPSSASLTYAYENLDGDDEETIFVFDLGGGTLDITIVNRVGRHFDVKSSSGFDKLGGIDFDTAIRDYVIDKFQKENNIILSSVVENYKEVKDSLLLVAEEAKISLSWKNSTKVGPKHIKLKDGSFINFRVDLTKDELEDCVKDILEIFDKYIDDALSLAGITSKDINNLIFVGGSTRMPCVREYVSKYLEFEVLYIAPGSFVDPMECVSRGAAICAAITQGIINIDGFTDIVPYSLGIAKEGYIFDKLIMRGTSYPVKEVKTYNTVLDNQKAIIIKVYQGERSMVKDNLFLGEFKLNDLAPAAKNQKISIEFTVDKDGILNVVAESSGKKDSILLNDSVADVPIRVDKTLIAIDDEDKEYDDLALSIAKLKVKFDHYKRDNSPVFNDIEKFEKHFSKLDKYLESGRFSLVRKEIEKTEQDYNNL